MSQQSGAKSALQIHLSLLCPINMSINIETTGKVILIMVVHLSVDNNQISLAPCFYCLFYYLCGQLDSIYTNYDSLVIVLARLSFIAYQEDIWVFG